MGKKLVDPNKLCMGCMEVLENTDMPCPHCGFHASSYQPVRNGLPLYEILNGKYLVGKAIGVGGFGITYIGWDFYQSKRVCIKEYFPRGIAQRAGNSQQYQIKDASMQYSLEVCTQHTRQAMSAYLGGLKSYIKEAENLSKFYTLPGIVSVRDFFYGNKTAYIVMEYIQGIDLRRYAKSIGGRLKPEFLFPILKDVFYALNEVHKENIIHRDISPDNIMITKDMKAKVIDFGAAKDYQVMHDNTVLLKHGYAPIEQYDRSGIQGPWTDIYSLSASIYYLLTGTKIPKAHDRVTNDTVKLLQVMGVPVTEEQDLAIKKALSIYKEERYQTMAEFYYDLYGEYLPGAEPVKKSERQDDIEKTQPISMNATEAAQKYLESQMK